MKLPDRTDKFAKTGAFEKTVDQKRCQEITENDQGRNRRLVPKIEGLVGPEVQHDESHGEPLRTQRSRPPTSRWKDFATQIPDKREWTCHAEKVADGEQADDGKRPPMGPRKD